MRRRQRRFVAALLALLLNATQPLFAVGHKRSGDCASAPINAELPPTKRTNLEPDATVPSGVQSPAFEVHYRLLNAQQCQCLAVQFAPLADTLAQERRKLADAHPCCDQTWVRCFLPCHCDDRANQLRAAILESAEQDARNRSAGAALELFFRIAEAEAKDDLLLLGRADLVVAHDQAKDLADQGFKLPIDLTSLDRQRLEVEADQARLQGGLNELNAHLKRLIGQDQLPANERLWPDASFKLSADPIDADAAVQTALAQRAELQLLRRLNCDMDAKTLPVIREFLKGVHATLGAQGGSNSPIFKMFETLTALFSGHASERKMRTNQLQQLLTDREKAVADEVRQALASMTTQVQLVELDRQRVLSWQSRVQDQRERVQRGESTFLDLLQAQSEWYKARAALIGDVMAWHRAYAQLRTAQGVLVGECACAK